MAKGNNETLTAEQEMQLRKPIEDYVGEIQKKIDSLMGGWYQQGSGPAEQYRCGKEGPFPYKRRKSGQDCCQQRADGTGKGC